MKDTNPKKPSLLKNEYLRLFRNIYFANSHLFGEFQKKLSEFNITPQQFNILKVLKESYPESLSMTEIKERMFDRNSDLTRLVDRLMEKGLVIRETDPDNRRKINLRLKSETLDYVAKIESGMMDFRVEFLTEEEAHTLNELLEKIKIKK